MCPGYSITHIPNWIEEKYDGEYEAYYENTNATYGPSVCDAGHKLILAVLAERKDAT